MDQQGAGQATTPKPTGTEAALRAEFYSLPGEAVVDRRTVAAVSYRSQQALEILATKGGGPAYRRVGRRALYRKQDVLEWIDAARVVTNTAQLQKGPKS